LHFGEKDEEKDLTQRSAETQRSQRRRENGEDREGQKIK
jgi:hypothetical protein